MSAIRELLLLHHTHTDLGYTHPQPVLWELHNRYLDEALDLCERTADWPEPCRMKWTCEVTCTFLHWLEHASESQVRRLHALVGNGQISFGAMWAHWMLPLPRKLFAASLEPVRLIRERFGAPVSVALQHDVNGIPWSAVDVLNEAGVPNLLLGINIHMGGFPLRRPLVFRWAGPGERSLLVFSGEHYNTFSREAGLREPDLDGMARGLAGYFERLEQKGWPRDFAFLTATHPCMDDNGPPNAELPDLVRRWNEQGRAPAIRLVTPEQLFERVRALPESAIPTHRGDWTDYWSSGSGSLALETQMLRRGEHIWRAARSLAAAGGIELNSATERETLRHLFLAHEHTVTAFCSTAAFGPSRQMEPLPIAQQWNQKAAYCAAGLSLAQMLRRDALDAVARNPVQALGCGGLLVHNPAAQARRIVLRVPSEVLAGSYPLLGGTKHRLDVVQDLYRAGGAEWIGPWELGPNELRRLSLAELPRATVAAGVLEGGNFIRSPQLELTFDRATGRITSLKPLSSGLEWLDTALPWDLFGPVRETVAERSLKSRECGDPRYDLFSVTEQDYAPVHHDRDCWNHDWPARREVPSRTVRVETRLDAEGAHLIRSFTMAGVNGELVQTITLLTHEPRVRFEAYFNKADVFEPEGLYFTFPFRMPQARARYDSGGVATEFDRDQLPGASRGWLAVGDWIAVAGDEGCLVLASPDAPMWQVGGFHYGRVVRSAAGLNQALLLAWPMNNYWHTNFRASQPGFIRLRYELAWLPQFDAAACARFGSACALEVVWHPCATE
jgi:alpha-mannosidase